LLNISTRTQPNQKHGSADQSSHAQRVQLII